MSSAWMMHLWSSSYLEVYNWATVDVGQRSSISAMTNSTPLSYKQDLFTGE